MAEILTEIVDVKRREVERLKVEVPLGDLESRIESQVPALNLSGALMGDGVRVIGETKRTSPVKGVLREDFDPVALAQAYADNGAAAISVLTNVDHFHGSIDDMVAVRARMYDRGVPVLRKDFVFDPYQVHESRAHGADAILLIVSILSAAELQELIALSQSYWMQCLVEVHDEVELETAVDAGAEIVGINNRNLRTFETSLAVTERLAPLVPNGRIVVSESGVSKRADVERVGRAGAHAVLVGEALVSSDDPGAKMRELA
jgi:indole-3-glycerol phosphate synthase